MLFKSRRTLSANLVGAAASGWCATIKLQQADLDVQILEKNDQVGGT
jgi:cation diffusion facilitator CzcD-associated flavoprotein CzcO